MLYLRNLAFKNGHQQALRYLLQRVRNEAFQKGYVFIAIGIHEHDPLQFVVRWLPKFTFVSHCFVTSTHNNQDSLTKIVSGIPMEDYALVCNTET